jgi:hypothetical protein
MWNTVSFSKIFLNSQSFVEFVTTLESEFCAKSYIYNV